MKYFLIGLALLASHSLSAQYNFYFGNIHSHSNYSDGNKDSVATGYYRPGDDYNYAKESYHMDFLGISEHNHYNATRNPGMRVANYAKGLYQADTANRNGTFVCLYRMEWGVISNGGHVVTYGVPGLIGWESGAGGWGPTNNYDIFCAKSDYSNFWPIVNSFPNAFCTLAHPENGDYNDLTGALPYNSSADSAIVGLALRSGSALSTTTDYSDPAPSSSESDFLKTLARGYHVGATMDHDNHYTTFGRANQTRTIVLAKELSKDSILAAYKAMRFYASDDWNATVNFTVNGNYMGSTFNSSSNSSIAVSVNDPSDNTGGPDLITRIQLYYGIPGSSTNATILTSNTGSSTLNFVHSTSLNSSYYYYAKITQVDGDIIWTSPIWITRTSLTLPVNLLVFAGKQHNEKVDLNWTTAQELNNDRFEIERSTDGLLYERIGTVFSKQNNSQTAVDYFYQDLFARKGINFYRLKQIDIDGNFSYSNIIAVNIDPTLLTVLKLSPNPADNYINVSCNSAVAEMITCKIYSSGGREVMNASQYFREGVSIVRLNISNLPAGTYFLVLSRPNERIAEGSFIKAESL